MIVVVNAKNRRLFEAVLVQMYRQRKAAFVDEAGWKIPIIGDTEMDAYDRDVTVYLLAKDRPEGQVPGIPEGPARPDNFGSYEGQDPAVLLETTPYSFRRLMRYGLASSTSYASPMRAPLNRPHMKCRTDMDGVARRMLPTEPELACASTHIGALASAPIA